MEQKYKIYTFQGLGTSSHKFDQAGEYSVECKSTIPTRITSGEDSLLVIAININGGGALYTSPVGSKGLRQIINVAANDTLNIVFSSSAASDQALNAVKTNIAISDGI